MPNLPIFWHYILCAAVLAYLLLMIVLGWWAEQKVQSVDDYVVAGRRLPLRMAALSLLATWFGAESMLTASGAVHEEGLRKAALDPLGAGLCLILAGLIVAARLWNMNLTTVADFFRVRYGKTAEMIAAVILIPSYFGWIAAQIVALANLSSLLFGIPVSAAILLCGLVGGGLALMGGMWAVTLNDSVQMTICLAGLVLLALAVLQQFGGLPFAGLAGLWNAAPAGHRVWVPLGETVALTAWIDALCIGALGNLPGQDLLQRVFSAATAKTARNACVLAGVAYLIFGSLTVLIGLGAVTLIQGKQAADSENVMTQLAGTLLSPPIFVVFILALFSAVISTIESAILSPAAVFAQNIVPRLPLNFLKQANPLTVNRWAVFAVTLGAIGMAYSGSSAYELVSDAYGLTLVALLVPLVGGLYLPHPGQNAAVASMAVGGLVWFGHRLFDASTLFPFLGPRLGFVPMTLGSTLIGALVFLLFAAADRARNSSEQVVKN